MAGFQDFYVMLYTLPEDCGHQACQDADVLADPDYSQQHVQHSRLPRQGPKSGQNPKGFRAPAWLLPPSADIGRPECGGPPRRGHRIRL